MAKNRHRWKIQLGATLAANPFLLNFFRGRSPGEAERDLRARIKLLLLPSCGGLMPHWGGPGRHRLLQIPLCLLCGGISVVYRGPAGTCGVRLPVPLRLVPGAAPQDPHKKFSTKRFHILTHLKYGILLLFVIILPMTVVNEVGMGDPFFYKYLCPAGILEGGIPLSLADSSIRASLGWLFTWKSCILLGIAVLSVFFYRPFCKWLCPLGAFYGLYNKVSVYRLEVNESKCTSCGACSRVCKMDVEVFHIPNHAECIRCGDCVATCPQQAITKTFALKRQTKKKETVT